MEGMRRLVETDFLSFAGGEGNCVRRQFVPHPNSKQVRLAARFRIELEVCDPVGLGIARRVFGRLR